MTTSDDSTEATPSRAATRRFDTAIAYLHEALGAHAQRAAAPAAQGEVEAAWTRAAAADVRDDADALAHLAAAAEVAARHGDTIVECKALASLAERHAQCGEFEAAYRARTRVLELTSGLVAQLGADLQNKMIQIEALHAQLSVEALHDPLTQLFNRRYLDSVVPGLIGSAARRGAPLALALVDLDHFKLVNDRYGHPAGDAVLREIGRVLPMAIRPADIVCRYGGEEFCVVLPDADASGAEKVLTSIAARLRDLRVAWNGHVLGGFTFSAGVSVLGVHGTAFADLLFAADRALYEAKDAGRDCVLVATRGAAEA
jgi:diguanylate cyclase (GGDEF)-like protein